MNCEWLMNEKCPMVAIILVNYNCAKDTLECIKSLCKIDYQNYKIIVVDNASTDDSYIRLEHNAYKYNYILLRAKKNNGFAAGNNLGIKYAFKIHPKYVLLLNNDTIVTSSFLIELLKNRPDDYSVLTGTILYNNEKNIVWYGGGNIGHFSGRVKHLFYNQDKKVIPANPLEVNFISGCEMLIPAKIIKDVGLLDEKFFLYEEDADYCIRIKNANYKLIYVPTSFIYHKISRSTSKTPKKTNYYLYRNKRILINKHFKGLQIITSLLFTNIQGIFRLITKRQSLECMIAGIIDFYLKKWGKTYRKFD